MPWRVVSVTVENIDDVLSTFWAPFLSHWTSAAFSNQFAPYRAPLPFSAHYLCAQVPSYKRWMVCSPSDSSEYSWRAGDIPPFLRSPPWFLTRRLSQPAGLCQHSPPSLPLRGSLCLPHSDLFPVRLLAARREGRPCFIIHWRTTAVRFHEIIRLFPEYNRSVADGPHQLSQIHWTL